MSFGICPSIGVGLSGSAGLSPAWLVNRLVARYTLASINALYIGDDMVWSGADMASWPGRVGAELTYSAVSSTRKFSRTTIGGRVAMTSADDPTNPKCLIAACAATKCFLLVTAPPASNVSAYKQALATSTSNEGFLRALTAAGATWWLSSTWTINNNNVATKAFTVGVPRLFHCDKAANVGTGLVVGSYDIAGTAVYDAPIACVVSLGVVPTEEQRAADLVDCNRYYRGALV